MDRACEEAVINIWDLTDTAAFHDYLLTTPRQFYLASFAFLEAADTKHRPLGSKSITDVFFYAQAINSGHSASWLRFRVPLWLSNQDKICLKKHAGSRTLAVPSKKTSCKRPQQPIGGRLLV